MNRTHRARRNAQRYLMQRDALIDMSGINRIPHIYDGTCPETKKE